MKKQRYYQIEAQTAVEKALKRGVINQMLVMAGGCGKTFTAVKIIKNKGRVLWGTHTSELISQSAIAILAEKELLPYNELLFIVDSHGGIIDLIRNSKRGGFFLDEKTKLISEQIGIVKADIFDINKPVVVCSMQTLHKRLHLIPPDHFGVVVGDECHLFLSKTFKLSLDHFKPSLRLLLTATPHRMDNMIMGDIADEIVYEYGLDRGIADGFLCELDALRIKTNINIDRKADGTIVRTTGGELNQADLEEVINTPERNTLIVEKYIQYASGRQFIGFAVDVQHAKDLCQAFKDRGLNVNFVVGDEKETPDRKKVVDDYKNEIYIGLINVQILVAGFDHPNTGCIVHACPTKSLTKYIQSTVRGSRLKDQKFVERFGQNCIVLDFIDVTTKHRLVNTWTLDKAKSPEDRTFTTQEKKLKLIAERERRIKISELQKDVRINLLKLPVPKVIDSMRMQEPATDGQLKWIAREGYDIININYTKQMCSEIISNLPASPNNVYWLSQRGYDVSQGVTMAEYKLALQEIKIREAKEATEKLKKEKKFPYIDIR